MKTWIWLFSLWTVFAMGAAGRAGSVSAPRASIVLMPLAGGLVDESGHGFVAELLQRVYQGAALPPALQTVPVKRALELFDHRAADMAVSVPLCRWHDAIYLTYGIHDYELFFGLDADLLPGPARDMAGQRIAVVRGFTHALRARQPQWRWVETGDYTESFRMLRAGMVDYVYGYAFLAASALSNTRGNAVVHFDPNLKVDETVPALVFHDDAAGLAAAQWVQQRLQQLSQAGDFQQLAVRYGLPAWFVADGVQGRFNLIRQVGCTAAPSP